MEANILNNVVRFPGQIVQKKLQTVVLPPDSVRWEIYRMWQARVPGDEIARRARVTKRQIQLVIFGFNEIHKRQSEIARMRFRVHLNEEYRLIAIRVWQDLSEFPPPTLAAATVNRFAA
jgi:hypothetical protein